MELDENECVKKVTFDIKPEKQIVIFVINRMSGPQFGEDIIEYLYQLFNPAQVIDLLDGEIQDIKIFKGISRLKVVVGGGDGTVSSISSVVRDLLGETVPVIPLPLGTGNDLSRAMGWGGAVNTKQELYSYISKLMLPPKPTFIDRWRITAISGADLAPFKEEDRGNSLIQLLLDQKAQKGGSTPSKQGAASKGSPREVIFDKQMFLYCGLGIGARLSYKFNTIREKFPNLFKSRIGNKFVYS